MKAKKQTLYPLRFDTQAQRDLIRKAAKLEQRSMNQYILRAILAQAKVTVLEHTEPLEQVMA
jgi:uncharacterized protein (DUF1778 family)